MEILRELQRMNKTIFISSHILSELAELCDSVTIIDRGKIKYSGLLHDLQTGGQPRRTYTLTLADDRPETVHLLARLPGVAEAKKLDHGPIYHVALEERSDGATVLLRGVLSLELSVVAFTETKKHLNDAFMELTTQGVR
jgi:ABC-2 type transport system ATP-binding protein